MREIFYEIIKEASSGEVIIDNDYWPFAFNTQIYKDGILKDEYSNDNQYTLLIHNENHFFKLLEEYIYLELERKRKMPRFVDKSDKTKIKWLIIHLFANATTRDFANPESFIFRNINFLKDNTLNCLNNGLELNLETLNHSTMVINKTEASTSMETPSKIDFKLKKIIDEEEVEYQLPSIYYGISEGICYIYSIIMPKGKRKISDTEAKYQKKMNRLLFKVNAGVEDTKEYYEYKKRLSDYYPDGNISDITHSFLLSLTAFISLLQKNNINQIRVVPYLPMRYLSRDLVVGEKDELILRNDSIQNNSTNKFLRTFLRLVYHNKNLEVAEYPYVTSEFLVLKIKSSDEKLNNTILEDTNKNIERTSFSK